MTRILVRSNNTKQLEFQGTLVPGLEPPAHCLCAARGGRALGTPAPLICRWYGVRCRLVGVPYDYKAINRELEGIDLQVL